MKEVLTIHTLIRKKHYHSFLKRGIFCLFLVSFVLALGTFCLHLLEGFSYVDAFYFTSMIATGQGPAPNVTPSSVAGKIFTCFLAFLSTGTMVASLGFLFGPFFGKLWRIGVLRLEEEFETLQKK